MCGQSDWFHRCRFHEKVSLEITGFTMARHKHPDETRSKDEGRFFKSAFGETSAAMYGALLLPNPTADQPFAWAFIGICVGVVAGLFLGLFQG